MDVVKALEEAAGFTQKIFSDAIRVLYAYPVFLVALGAIVLYTAVQCL